MRLRRSSTILVYWDKDRLVFDNYRTQVAVTADPVTLRVLNLCDRWRSPEQMVREMPEYSGQSVRKALRKLLQYSLLLKEGSRDAKQDAELSKTWGDWLPYGSFHFGTKNVKFISGKKDDNVLRDYLQKSTPPPIHKKYRRAPRVTLKVPAIEQSEFLNVLFKRRTHREFSARNLSFDDLSQLLYCTWGVSEYRPSILGLFPRKTSPSGGARHPVEAYVLAMKVEGLAAGLYHYDCQRHCLELLHRGPMQRKAVEYCAGQTYVENAAALFLMTAVFPRSIWKYRFARAYRVVMLDAGHLCQTFCLTATFLGLAPFCTAALKDSSIEKDLGLDGINESVIYAAGVGCQSRRLN